MRRKSGHAVIDDWTGAVVASDEVGYGSYAGPLVVCAASAPIGWDDPRVKDSKALSYKALDALFEELAGDPRFVLSIITVSSEEIDQMGVYKALLSAHRLALQDVAARNAERHNKGPFLGVVDGNLPVHTFGLPFELVALPKADRLVPECSLASILAKVTRDRMMVALDKEFPGYGLDSNKGYGTPDHHAALEKLGPCPQHRKSYAPIARLIAQHRQPETTKYPWEAFDE